jgi:hypothetical protein
MQRSKFLRWVVALAIIIILNLFFNYAIFAFYKAPQYNDFCSPNRTEALTANACAAQGGKWNTIQSYPDASVTAPIKPVNGYCDLDFTCREQYGAREEVYNRNVFIVLIILGVASIALSFLVTSYEAVSLGLSGGGVLSFIIGTIRFWSNMDDYLRVIVLGLALLALVWFGIKKIRYE